MNAESETPGPGGAEAEEAYADGVGTGVRARPREASPVDYSGGVLEALLAASPVHLYGHDLAGRYLFASPAGARGIGQAPEEIVGRTWRELGMPAEIMEPFDRNRERVLASGEPIDGQTMYPTGEGNRVFAYTISPIRDTDGRLTGTVTTSTDVTDLHRTDEALAESEARFRSAFEHAAIGMALVDLDGRFRHANRSLCQLLGYDADELGGLTFEEITHPDDREAGRVGMRLLRARETDSFQLEKRYFHKDGRVIWAQLSSSLVRDSRGRALYFITQIQDITERKEAAEAQQRLTAILEATPDLVGTADPQGRTLYLNRAGRDLCTKGEDPVGRHVSTYVTEPAAHRLLMDAIPTAVREGVWSGETTLVDAEGRGLPASQVLIGHRGDGGEVQYISTIIRDLSGPKRAEERQRFLAEASQAMSGSLDLEEILGKVATMLVADFADYCVVDVTVDHHRGFAAAHADPGEQERVDRLRAWPPGGDARVGSAAVLRSGEAQLVTTITPAWIEAVSRDEAHRRTLSALGPTSQIIAPLRARDGVVGTVTCAWTHSDRSYAGEDLLLLESLASRAGLAIDNARLYAEARAAVRVRDQVLRVVAHDLRSPLHAISLSAQTLRDALPAREGGGVGRRLDAIGRATRRANRLIEDLLDLARVESGGLSVEPAEVDARALIEEVVRLHRVHADDRGIRLDAELARELPPIRGDRHRLHQVFDNLVGNALKFVPRGGAVTVGAAAADGEVRLWVSDTGPGIPPEQQALVFDSFWQAQDGARHGAGLGLAIARAIVEAHGGELQVESEVGEGSTFSFCIQRA